MYFSIFFYVIFVPLEDQGLPEEVLRHFFKKEEKNHPNGREGNIKKSTR